MNIEANFQSCSPFAMNAFRKEVQVSVINGVPSAVRCCLVVLILVLGVSGVAQSAGGGKAFSSPEEAVAALAAAAATHDSDAIRTIFGSAAEDLENPDRVQAANELEEFTRALGQARRIVHDSTNRCVLEVGENPWPFPVPMVEREGRWFFDPVAGAEELLNRRIGRNELAVLRVMRAYVDAQREYASRDRDGDQVLEYAQRLASSPGAKDGLYWPQEPDEEISPLGPFVAGAQGEGYDVTRNAGNPGRAPFHGYYFKILTRQGKHAPGGRYDYIINGNMIGGFALVAWPAEYGASGVMTFIVNQQGRIYQRNLGRNTIAIASRMQSYDPDSSWKVCTD